MTAIITSLFSSLGSVQPVEQNFFFKNCVWTVPALLLQQRKVYNMTLWIIYLTSTHPKLSKNVYVYCTIPNSLFITIFFKRAKTVCLQELSVPFCGVLNELMLCRKLWSLQHSLISHMSSGTQSYQRM